ncbi:hypothetical protein NBRC110019_31690 [Neptunitalea chrysea]|uniref:Uncharacterized protein n=2 Tax=Neptunitalea chrysea TaxID=1647581 RepID=A0A9W6EX08_9FLAO|nr:hypothetical protein NBRC110019_31690 [Neptunitalea chrysea]
MISFLGYGHAVDEFLYEFKFTDTKCTLKVHLTTIGIIEVLKGNFEVYKDKTIFDFTEHTKDYEMYFNKHIKLLCGKEKLELVYINSDLVSHDAWMLFEMKGHFDATQRLKVLNNAFTDIYKSAVNRMGFTYKREQVKLTTYKESKSVTVFFKVKEPKETCNYMYLLIYGCAIVSLGTIIVLLFRVRKKND